MRKENKAARRLAAIALLLVAVLQGVYSNSMSLETMVTSVTNGPDSFGLGMAPAGSSFIFYDYFNLIPGYKNKAYFKYALSFKYYESSVGGYDYDTGRPHWSMKRYEGKKNSKLATFYYFYPTTYMDFLLEQGFFTNPISGSGPLLKLSIGFFTDYALSLERTAIHGGEGNPTFVNPDGSPKEPFGPDSWIQAYPWLSGDRETWFNYAYTQLSLNLYKSTGFNTYDGLSGYIKFVYGPKWLLNNLSDFPTSDFFNLSASLSEYLSLYVHQQKNGYNWMSIGLTHSNTFSYTDGSIIPAPWIPTNRLKYSLSDSLSIQFNGPHFFSKDCYYYVNLSLNNTLRWGGVVNEKTGETKAVELTSSINSTFYLRLFGFIRFQYSMGYNFYRGLTAGYPYWSQGAELRIFIQI